MEAKHIYEKRKESSWITEKKRAAGEPIVGGTR